MKNGDRLAMPIEINGFRKYAPEAHGGMTKREMIAMHAMSSYIGGIVGWTDGLDGGSVQLMPQEAATEAVRYADALLEELEKQQ